MFKICRQCFTIARLFLAVAALNGTPAQAADVFPSKPIRIIVPAAPGGTTDIATRLLADRMGAELGQTIVVENRAGAAGIIGVQVFLAAVPDGYTIMMGNIGPNAINYAQGPGGGIFGGGPGGFDPGAFRGGFGGVGDILSDLFGGGARGGPARPERGRDLETDVHVSFEQAMDGAQVPVSVRVAAKSVHADGAHVALRRAEL